jgi:hypothetical protein
VKIVRATTIACAVLVLPSCASLEGLRALVQPPAFRQTDRPAEVRLAGPSRDRPFGGATVRLWTEVSNPNPFGFTLGTLDGTLFLEARTPPPRPSHWACPSARSSEPSSRSSCRSVSPTCPNWPPSSAAPRTATRWSIASMARLASTPGRWGSRCSGR